MPYCPRCEEDFVGDLSSCPNCGYEFEIDEDESSDENWIVVARIGDKMSADYAKETLESYSIPAVVISESGFLGQAGLNLPSITGKGISKFQIHIPAEYREEAEDILNMILGDAWEKGELDL